MKKALYPVFAVLLVLLLVSCASVKANLGKGYSVVLSSVTSDKETVTLAKSLASKLGSNAGVPFSVGMDGNAEAQYEISLGITNREYSRAYTSGLRSDDWVYAVKDGKIVIAGGNTAALGEAVRAFLDYVDDCGNVLPEVECFHKGEYTVDSFRLGGVPVADYTIVVPSMSGEIYRAACFLRNYLIYRTGYLLDIATSAGGRAIRVGLESDDSAPAYRISSDGKNLSFDGPRYMLMGAIREFFAPAVEAGSRDIDLALPPTAIEAPGNYENGFVAVSSADTVLRDGVTYTVDRYIDADGAPVVAYTFKVEKGAATLINGTPGNAFELHDVRATTQEAAQSAAEAGYDVIGAVNADFFRMSEDGSPRGTCIKDSVVMQITETSSRSYFAVLDDGSYHCAAGAPSADILPHIVEAVGGGDVLVKDGRIVMISTKERHPRTVAGYDHEGTAYLIVVDGRQTKISNGAYLGDMSLLLLQAGAEEGINLDGGGSSTVVLNENGILRVKNSPSDGSLRKVYNSIVVVGNKK